ncbi:hypothetical protein DFP72DRAFT_821122 [Ephemerocybe angulata]|uniref:Uncharacterized protein n=1 Tax=Ephemerocybe angulata TaxID=980116 RepID=A0A8H6HJ53_9AGAR|nr:hypothetical protein DFP72DRAFT_821122 [Tulosesus angulatus]
MLSFALEYRQAIARMSADADTGLRRFELDRKEWDIVKQLVEVLKHATMFFSRGTPNLPTVIPAMDRIDDILTNQSLDTVKFAESIRAACTLSKATLNRYYNKTDTSETYRIAMILHPRYKLQYFRNRRWETDWIETAEEILRDEYKRSYGPLDVDNTADATSSGFDPGPGPSTVRVMFRGISFRDADTFS